MIPRIAQHMTAAPHTIGADATLAFAEALMREYEVRHLPVLRGGELIGIVSQRDLLLLGAVAREQLAQIKVEEAIAQEVFTVPPDAKVHEVARELADRRIGSALVAEYGRLLGIFTTTDALLALAQYAGPAAKRTRKPRRQAAQRSARSTRAARR